MLHVFPPSPNSMVQYFGLGVPLICVFFLDAFLFPPRPKGPLFPAFQCYHVGEVASPIAV